MPQVIFVAVAVANTIFMNPLQTYIIYIMVCLACYCEDRDRTLLQPVSAFLQLTLRFS